MPLYTEGESMRAFSIAAMAAVASVCLIANGSAADLVVKAPPPVTSNWTGWYVGGNIGGGWSHRTANTSPNDPGAATLLSAVPIPAESFSTSGVLGGVQVGYNYQFNRTWLVGVEADFDWADIKGSTSTDLAGGLIAASLDERINWFGTVRARVGWLPTPDLLVYGTGGFAYGRVAHSGSYGLAVGPSILLVTVPPFSLTCNGPATCMSGSSHDVVGGWTAGGGLEYRLWEHWSIKAEYLYVRLDRTSVTETAVSFAPGATPISWDANFGRGFNVARVGLNYHF